MLLVTNSCGGSSAIPALRERDASCLNVKTMSHDKWDSTDQNNILLPISILDMCNN